MIIIPLQIMCAPINQDLNPSPRTDNEKKRDENVKHKYFGYPFDYKIMHTFDVFNVNSAKTEAD